MNRLAQYDIFCRNSCKNQAYMFYLEDRLKKMDYICLYVIIPEPIEVQLNVALLLRSVFMNRLMLYSQCSEMFLVF